MQMFERNWTFFFTVCVNSRFKYLLLELCNFPLWVFLLFPWMDEDHPIWEFFFGHPSLHWANCINYLGRWTFTFLHVQYREEQRCSRLYLLQVPVYMSMGWCMFLYFCSHFVRKVFSGTMNGSNSRSHCLRSRYKGWAPSFPHLYWAGDLPTHHHIVYIQTGP